ncbi:class I SAM-dependent DNA methyltransferase [Phreatobacter sp.]|uniref:class I SAM-dependent DNA methyltransferase n=1 Tax=Phreatobacter sp. TaxID=1966341 RepID=UPI0025F8C78A|nr:class I SAM-dependent methyltransferase [Phreatobacter sp.]
MASDMNDRHAADVPAFYEKHTGDFDRERGRDLMERDHLAAAIEGLRPGARVLDLGCGTGQPIAAHLVSEGFRVTGVDVAEAMIVVCRGRFPGHEWIAADMRRLDLGRIFGAVVAWDSFFHLPRNDQRAMFPVFARHVAPGGSLLFTSGPSDGEVVGSLYGDPLFHASLAPAEYRSLLDASGFDVVRHVVEDPDCGSHTVWLARRRVIVDPTSPAPLNRAP